MLPALIAGVASSAFGNYQANKQMRFQERMSSTAHQRQVKDMRKAGLNPILSATGGKGASSPSGAMSSIDPTSSALSARRLRQELENLAVQEMKTSKENLALSGAAALGQLDASIYKQPAFKAARTAELYANSASSVGNAIGSFLPGKSFKNKPR
jgi:hypothetical protein